MKKLIKPFITGCIAIAGCISSLQAQDMALAENGYSKNDLLSNPFATKNTDANKPVANVNTKVLNAFTSDYKNATNITWYVVNRNYLAMFDWNGLKAHAMIGKNGYTIYNVRYGTEKDLPAAVRRLIKSNYVDYTIGKVSEVNVEGQNAWLVNLEDENNLVIARVMDDALEEMAHYQTHLQPKKHRKARIVIPAQ
jgi:hypothetical protein